MSKGKTIEEVVKNNLCTGCATCVSLCPCSAIELIKDDSKGIYLPRLNENECNQCGTCFDVCPGHTIDFKALNLEIFGKEPEDILIGNYLNCYIGHATDYDIRYNSASGGLITTLLIFALEEGIIDGALVTRMKKDNPLEPESFIARTREEIIEASKSKYCPVPANVALKEILNSGDGEKFAVVGLPCHIHGIRKAEQINKKLKEKIILHLGIICLHTTSFLGTEFLLQKLNVKKEDIIKIDYRGGGWPGRMLIILKNNNSISISLHKYHGNLFRHFFIPLRCILCHDETCDLADISFGDAWLPESSGDKNGKSIIILRSKNSKEILYSAISKNKIKLIEINSNKVILSQGITKKFKAYNPIYKIFCIKRMPIYASYRLRSNPIACFYIIIVYLNFKISSNRFLRYLLKYLPFPILVVYSRFIGIIKRLLKLNSF